MQLIVPLAVTIGAYTAGNCVGGKILLPGMRRRGQPGLAITDVQLIDKSAQNVPYNLFLFDADLVGAIADRTAYTMDARDRANSQGFVPLVGMSSGIINLTPLYKRLTLKTLDAYAVLVAGGAPTFASTSDLSLKITTEQVQA